MNRLLIHDDKIDLLLSLMAADFERGFLLIDPSGDLAEAIADRLPEELTPQESSIVGNGKGVRRRLRHQRRLARTVRLVKSKDGRLLAYVGIAVEKEQSPCLLFHNFDSSVIFNVDRIEDGEELYLVRDPLEVLKAFASGVGNCIAFLTEGANAQQLEQLASFMDERRTELVYLP